MHAHLRRVTLIHLIFFSDELGVRIDSHRMNVLPLGSASRHRLYILRILQHLLAQIAVHEGALDSLLFTIAREERTLLDHLIFHAA